jgi:hypothetical protein
MTATIKLSFGALLLAGCLVIASPESQATPCCVPPPPPPQKVLLLVCHPCTECKAEISVCLPACCQGTPSVCFQPTILGCGKTVYEWSCGYRVIVRYTHSGGFRVIER